MLSLLLICVASVAGVPLEYSLPLPPSLPSGPYPDALPYPEAVPVLLEVAPIPPPALFAPLPPPPIPVLPYPAELEIGFSPEAIPVVTGPYAEAIPETVGPYPEAIPISVGPYPEALPILPEVDPIITGPYPEAIPIITGPYPDAIPIVTGPYPDALPIVYEDAEVVHPSSIYDPASDALVLPTGSRVDVRDEKGQFSTGFSSPDGTQVSEEGRLITTNGGWEYVIAKTGSYSYTSPEGIVVDVKWIADENGFRHLPA